MSENKTEGAAPASESSAPVDEIKNLKAEFNRKLGNVEATLKSSNEQLLAQLQTMLKPKAPEAKESKEDLETLMYTKPAEAIRRIKDEAKSEIRTEIDARDAENNKRNVVIQKLYSEYPELAIDGSELNTLAVKKYDEMAKEYGHSPAIYKAAVAEAAQETGLKPKSKRPVDDDNFSLSGSGSRSNRPASKKDSELSPLEKMAAEAFGVSEDRIKARKAKKPNLSKWG